MAMKLTEQYAHRHPSTVAILRWLEPNPNLPDDVRAPAEILAGAAAALLDRLEDGPELTTGLRRLVEAKDCFVRQGILDAEA